ncbi:MAG: DUF2461 domain-containing protein [Candidatus Kapaibacteriota bacterium]
MIKSSTIRFLEELNENNNKDWFSLHKNDYENAKNNFQTFIQQIINIHSGNDNSIMHLTAKDCIFRINKDIRFSKDKSPYKINFGASINKAGRKAWNTAGYYFHLQPGSSFAGGGIYMPEPKVLAKLRYAIEDNFDEFEDIIFNDNFQNIFGELSSEDGMKLIRVPKGFSPESPAADFLKYKSFVAMASISDKELLSDDIIDKTLIIFEAIQPLINFINKYTQ